MMMYSRTVQYDCELINGSNGPAPLAVGFTREGEGAEQSAQKPQPGKKRR
eukprot:COSAG01_NODE_23362_length_818_cov_0.997218_1_plen_49_part_01